MSETVTVVYAEGEPGADRDGLLAEHGGTRERATDDGHLLSFRSVRAAVGCAVALQRDGGDAAADRRPHRRARARRRRAARARARERGADRGPGARRGDPRLVGRARLADLDPDGDVWFDDGAEVELRGLRGRHLVVPVQWEERPRAPVRVVIADDSAIVRDGVAALLREHGFDVVATAGDAVGLHEAVERHRPDVAVVDIRMPPTHSNEGLVAAEAIRATHPCPGVLIGGVGSPPGSPRPRCPTTS